MLGREYAGLNRAGAQGETTEALARISAALEEAFSFFMVIVQNRKAKAQNNLASIVADGEVNG